MHGSIGKAMSEQAWSHACYHLNSRLAIIWILGGAIIGWWVELSLGSGWSYHYVFV